MSSSSMSSMDPYIKSLLPFTIGILKPLYEEAGKAFDSVAQSKDTLHESHQENIIAEPLLEPDNPYIYEEDVSDYEPDDTIFKRRYKGHYSVVFREGEDGTISLQWTFGRGNGKLGKSRGVSHRVIAPNKDPRGVIGQHLTIQIDADSGALVAVGHNDNFPAYIFDNNEKKNLGKGQTSVLPGKINQLGMGKLIFNFTLQNLDPIGRKNYRRVRDYALAQAGKKAPDPRIHVLPLDQPFNRAGKALLHQPVNKGSWGTVNSGVIAESGQTCAVKHMFITEAGAYWEIEGEIAILLSYKNCPGLMQASEVCDDQGNSFGPGQATEAKKFFRGRRLPFIIYLIMPLAVCNLWEMIERGVTFPQKVELSRMWLQGLGKLHADGWIDRDVSPDNVLITSTEPLIAKLADFGKAVKRPTHTSNLIGRPAFMAPECNGKTEYTNAVDMWSSGLVITKLLLPDMDRWHGFDLHKPQTPAFMQLLHKNLAAAGRLTRLGAAVVAPLHRMLDLNPKARPGVPEVLQLLPDVAAIRARVIQDAIAKNSNSILPIFPENEFEDIIDNIFACKSASASHSGNTLLSMPAAVYASIPGAIRAGIPAATVAPVAESARLSTALRSVATIPESALPSAKKARIPSGEIETAAVVPTTPPRRTPAKETLDTRAVGRRSATSTQDQQSASSQQKIVRVESDKNITAQEEEVALAASCEPEKANLAQNEAENTTAEEVGEDKETVKTQEAKELEEAKKND